MSCAVALIEDGIYVGSDSQYTSTGGAVFSKNPKYFRSNNVFVLVVGHSRILQLMQQVTPNNLTTPGIADVRGIANNLRTLLDDDVNFEVIVAYNGKIFSFIQDFVPIEIDSLYYASGSGAKYALGALYALRSMKVSPKEKVRLALEASEKDIHVGGFQHIDFI